MKSKISICLLVILFGSLIHAFAQSASQPKYAVWSFAYSPDGKYLVIGFNDGLVQIRDKQGALIQAIEINESNVYGSCWNKVENIYFTPDGTHFYTRTNCTLYLLDVYGNKYSKFQVGDKFKSIFISKGGDSMTIVDKNLGKFTYDRYWNQLDYFNFAPKLDLPKNIVFYPVLYGSAITKNGNFIAVYDKVINRKGHAEFYLTEYDKKNNPIRNIKLEVPLQDTKLCFSFNTQKNIAYIHVNNYNSSGASGFLYDANTGEMKSLFGIRDENGYSYNDLILNPDGRGFINENSYGIRFLDINGQIVNKYEKFPFSIGYSQEDKIVWSADYMSFFLPPKYFSTELKNLKMETLLSFDAPLANQIVTYTKLPQGTFTAPIVQVAEIQKPVYKLQDKDLEGTCEQLLIKAEDTDDPEDYLVIVKKALEKVGNDVALKVVCKSALVEYHLNQNEQKEAETLLAEISGLVKGTTNLYANFNYQYAVADLLFLKEEYAKAKIEFQKALDIALKLGKSFYIKHAYNAIANSQYYGGDPVKAIETLKKGIAFPVDDRTKLYNANLYRAQAKIFRNYGDPEKAVDCDLEALKILQLSDRVLETGFLLKTIGDHYATLRQDDKSINYLKQAIKIFENLDRKDLLVECYGTISYPVFRVSSSKTEAVGYAEKAYNIAKSIGNKQLIAQSLLYLAIADMNFNPESKMLPRLQEGYALAKEIEDDGLITSFENWLGMYYDIRGEFDLAIPYYKSIVSKAERSRATVSDDLKLNYWKSEYGNYKNIVGCYLHLKDFPNVINSIEQSSGRLLYERIAKQIGKTDTSPIEISKTYNTIPANQALLFYGNSGGQDMAILTANSSSIVGRLVNSTMWVKSIENKYKFAANENFEKLRAFKKIKTEENESFMPTKPDEGQSEASKKSFEDIVNNYRSLLSKPNKTQADLETLDFLGRRFYQLLVKPIEDKLADKSELVIVPNDVLAFLPFEAFIMTDGRYLVEKYDIRYLPSYSTGQVIAQRVYPDTRKPIIAFGNAIYNLPNQQQAKASATTDFAELIKGVQESANKGENMRKYYQALNFEWDNLPGTQAEIEAIMTLQPAATLIKGKEVNKGNVIKMSQQGVLKNYRILHFATHGVVIPEFQELSAIVLTQGLTTDDGYLRASEVAKLNLNADFVNLSACETGLGKIYGGEGVVGLTQAFLLAGANSISVSLWQVSDASTMEFQKELYRLVFAEKMPVSKAINQVKRTFIKGQYNQPFYWAPFVYYGM